MQFLPLMVGAVEDRYEHRSVRLLRLSQHAISTAAVEWETVDDEVWARYLAETGLEVPPQVLALHHARVLDRILDGAASEEDAVLRDLLQKRNHSILAHGLESMNAKAAARFLEYVDAMVDVPRRGSARSMRR
jgi:hypothetical protein